jgi:hypothetical protein
MLFSSANYTLNTTAMAKKILLILVAALTSLATAQAQTEFTLTFAPEGAGGRTGSGSGTLTLNGTTITFGNVSFSGMSGTMTVAHIHGPAGPFPASAGVIYDMVPFITLGSDNRSGTVSGSFNLVDNPNNRGFTVAQQLDQLNGGLWYFNIHTSPQFGGGEIRAQIVPVPEPSTVTLLAMGSVAGLALYARRRKN